MAKKAKKRRSAKPQDEPVAGDQQERSGPNAAEPGDAVASGASDETAARPNQPHPQAAHEPNAVSVRFVSWAAGGLTVLIVVALLLMYGMFEALAFRGPKATAVPVSLAARREQQIEPPLEPEKRQQLLEMRTAEAEWLSSYAWVDEQEGVARIPIERAIEIFSRQMAEEKPADGAEQTPQNQNSNPPPGKGLDDEPGGKSTEKSANPDM